MRRGPLELAEIDDPEANPERNMLFQGVLRPALVFQALAHLLKRGATPSSWQLFLFLRRLLLPPLLAPLQPPSLLQKDAVGDNTALARRGRFDRDPPPSALKTTEVEIDRRENLLALTRNFFRRLPICQLLHTLVLSLVYFYFYIMSAL